MTPLTKEQEIYFKEQRRQKWLDISVRPWADKHGITVKQALSVLFFDCISPRIYPTPNEWVEANDFALTTWEELK